METRTASTAARRTRFAPARLLDWSDPALWAWAVVLVMIAVPAAATLA